MVGGKPRVNGRLDMTRSIGDLDLKPYGVIAEPSTKVIKVRHSRDAFLVLTTDGVNVSLTDQEIVDIINGRTDPEEAAKQVTDQALQFGSEDNATAVVMPFGAWGKYSRAVSTIQYDFGRNIIGPRYS
ncbi:hypothetical protein NP493_7234g00002 [Ridgeia piscesae]|uniref:PPM-type phosphatase domain-containing protein n=1 Tax=Ridgeia piscesae TaxID=27915 RepID=A0AAD9IQL9_RIDPI|nr:hypothetical protein NP493_7234g00002 [Ridgeia piscesae]